MLVGKAHVKATLELWNQTGEVEMAVTLQERVNNVIDMVINNMQKDFRIHCSDSTLAVDEREEAHANKRVLDSVCAFLDKNRKDVSRFHEEIVS